MAAKDSMNLGDRIYLPITVQETPIDKKECHCNEDEASFIRSLEMYKVLGFHNVLFDMDIELSSFRFNIFDFHFAY